MTPTLLKQSGEASKLIHNHFEYVPNLCYVPMVHLPQPHPLQPSPLCQGFRPCAANTTYFVQLSQQLNTWGKQL